MPPTNTQHRPLKEAPRPRHKSKPKFDVPAEFARSAQTAVETTGPQETPVGWVYRANEVSPAPPQPQTGSSPDNPVLMVGVGFFLIGLGALEFLSRATHGIIMMPARFAKAFDSLS